MWRPCGGGDDGLRDPTSSPCRLWGQDHSKEPTQRCPQPVNFSARGLHNLRNFRSGMT
jgi:hypothetical protein